MSFLLAAAMMLSSSNSSVTVGFETSALGAGGCDDVNRALDEGFNRFESASSFMFLPTVVSTVQA
jgi:hypothetical protein